MKMMLPMIMQGLKPMAAKDADTARDFDEAIPVVAGVMNSYADSFVNETAQIYARHFSIDELRQLTAFYKTPTGAKLLQKQPEITQEVISFSQKLLPGLPEDIKKSLIEELRKRGHKLLRLL